MKYQLIGIDIDGTLLNSEYRISERTKRAIRQASEAGCIVTLVTGRRYKTAVPYAFELGLDVPLICFNGGLIADASSGQALHTAALEESFAREIVKRWHSLRAPIFAYRHSLTPPDVYHQNPHSHPRVQDYLKRYAEQIMVVDNLSRELTWQPLRMMTFGEASLVERCYYNFEDLWQRSDIRTLLTSDYDDARFLEVYPHNATKANGLRWLGEYLGIRPEQVVVFGDNLNDIDMLEWAGLGVAMGNALPEVQAAADLVTADRDNDGIAVIIEDLLDSKNKFAVPGL